MLEKQQPILNFSHKKVTSVNSYDICEEQKSNFLRLTRTKSLVCFIKFMDVSTFWKFTFSTIRATDLLTSHILRIRHPWCKYKKY